MVLSNKKLKQKLREAKAAAFAASDAQTSITVKSSGLPNSEAQESVKSLLAHKSKLSKRKKGIKKALPLPGNGQNRAPNDEDRVVTNENEEIEGSEGLANVKKEKKKRKRDAVGKEELERGEVKEKKLKKKITKKKAKENKKEKEEKGGAEESLTNVNAISGNNEASSDDRMKVYVGGIPYYSMEDDIRSYFEGCGTITQIDCMKFPESGKFRGIAIISFRTEAAAKRALALDGSDMGGLFLRIQPYKLVRAIKTSDFAPEMVEGYNRVYAGNLSWDIAEDDLKKLFSGCKIKCIRFGEDKETGKFKGYAHVDFSDSLSLSMALKLDQTVVCGRPVRISCAVPRKDSVKKSHPTPESTPSAPRTESTANSDATPADAAAVASVNGKIRRRTCYECGERGHLSSSCPRKQVLEQTNSASS